MGRRGVETQVAGPRRCYVCGETKDLSHFYPRRYRSGTIGFASKCKRCARSGIDRQRNRRADALRHNWGLGIIEYDALLASQGGCAICGVSRSQDGRRLAVDHDHDTGLIRGLLCTRCNQILGAMEERGVDRLLGYLRTPPAVDVLGHRFVPSKQQSPSPQLTLDQIKAAEPRGTARRPSNEVESHARTTEV